MTIPEIRERLYQLADEHNLDELKSLADQLHRREPITRAPATSVPKTPELGRAIRQYKKDHPTASQVQIAAHFRVNNGRVSEALNNEF